MKKFLALLLTAYAVVMQPSPQRLCDLIEYIPDATYSVYAQGECHSIYAKRVANGADTILTCDVRGAQYLYRDVECVQGEMVTFSGDQADLDELCRVLDFCVVVPSEIPGCYYGYSSRLGTGVLLGGKKVNCQIVCSEGKIVVGWPLILGSYHLT